MKLGDAGEAFFVELKDDESTVAPYLCTSPLPAEDAQQLMERGLQEMKSQVQAEQVPFYDLLFFLYFFCFFSFFVSSIPPLLSFSLPPVFLFPQ